MVQCANFELHGHPFLRRNILTSLIICVCTESLTIRANGLTKLMPALSVLSETVPEKSKTPAFPAGTTVNICDSAVSAHTRPARPAADSVDLNIALCSSVFFTCVYPNNNSADAEEFRSALLPVMAADARFVFPG